MWQPVTTRSVRFLGNAKSGEVHDLQNEHANCQIEDVLAAGHAVGFTPDTLARAHEEGFDGHVCIGRVTWSGANT